MAVNDLAEEFSITRRQVYRDLQRIEEEGHPLIQSGEVGERMWQFPLGYRGLPPVTVSPYELMSLHLAKSHLAYMKGTPFVEDLDDLISKVQAGLPAKTVNPLGRIGQVFAPLQGPIRSYAKQKEVLTNLRKALLLQNTVTLHHQAGLRRADAASCGPVRPGAVSVWPVRCRILASRQGVPHVFC